MFFFSVIGAIQMRYDDDDDDDENQILSLVPATTDRMQNTIII